MGGVTHEYHDEVFSEYTNSWDSTQLLWCKQRGPGKVERASWSSEQFEAQIKIFLLHYTCFHDIEGYNLYMYV